jgi:hypothetical protein
MKYYEVDLHSDELNRMGKKDFHPFVAELDKKYWDYEFAVQQGKYIDSWDENICMNSCQDGKPDDLLATGAYFLLFSDKVIELFNKNGITGFQYLPIKIYKMNVSRLEGYNYVANIYNQVECLDLEKSKYDFYDDIRPDLKGKIKHISKFVLVSSKIPTDLDIFRLKEQEVDIIASERLASLYIKNKFTNLAFNEVEVV